MSWGVSNPGTLPPLPPAQNVRVLFPEPLRQEAEDTSAGSLPPSPARASLLSSLARSLLWLLS